MTFPSASRQEQLVRGIGPWALTAFAINLTIGAGIFGLPARIQALAGNYSILIIIVCGLLIALIALCFAEIASRFDASGGPQLYASVAFGPAAGFTVGWLLWLSRMGTCAAVSNLLVDYGKALWPYLDHSAARAAVITLLVLAYTLINVRGIRQTAAVSTAFTVVKLIPLLAFAAVGLFFVDWQTLQLGAFPSTTDLSNAMLLAAFAFFGFDATTVMAGEVRNSHRSIPFAIMTSVATVAVLYALIELVCVGTLPNLASSERPLADAAVTFVGPWGSPAIALTVVIACAGVFGASFTPATRLLFAMSHQGQLPAALAQIHPRFRTPVPAIIVTAAVVLALALSGSFIYLVKLTLIARVTVYAVTCTMLPIFRRRADVPKATFMLPAGKAVAYTCATLCLLLMLNSSMRELFDVALAVLGGLVVFGLTRYVRRAQASA